MAHLKKTNGHSLVNAELTQIEATYRSVVHLYQSFSHPSLYLLKVHTKDPTFGYEGEVVGVG